jgi:O-antigen/teichoic acid export membrane protein
VPLTRATAPTGATFGTNVLWNMASLAFLAAAGLFLNFVIARWYGAEALGLFNIVFALYIFLSQISVLGVHHSVLRYVSEFAGSHQRQMDATIAGALMLVAILATCVTLLALIATPLVAAIYRIDGIGTAWWAMLPALWCFSINKVLLNAINGAEHMRAFAVLQAVRYALVLAALAVVLATGLGAEWLPGILSAAEAVLLPVLVWYTGGMLRSWDWAGGRDWLKAHLSFGARVFPSGTLAELNTRVDVLMIGAMLDGARAGVYSVALLLAEGLAQAIVVVRSNLNPVLGRLLLAGKIQELAAFGRRVSAGSVVFMAVAGLLLVSGFAATVNLLFTEASFAGAVVPLALLVAGLVLASTYLPFGMAFSQAGRPFLQTLFSAAVLGVNVTLNAVLIPLAGINGAALGTGLSYVAAALLLLLIMRRVFQIRIWV